MTIGRIDINEKDLPKICGAIIQLEERADADIGGSGDGVTGTGSRLTNVGLVISASAGALTIALKGADGNDPSASSPVTIDFRNATLITGTPSTVSVQAATSVVLASSNTMGVTNATAFRIWVVAFNNIGTVELGAINCLSATTGIFQLAETVLQSSSASSTNLAAGVFATTTARSTLPIRILGYIEWDTSGLAAAGTWTTTNLKSIQLFGPGIKKPGDTVQKVVKTETRTDTTSSTTYVATGFSSSITPTSAANLLEILSTGAGYSQSAGAANALFKLSKGTTANTNMIGSITIFSALANVAQAAVVCLTYNLPNTAASQAYAQQFQNNAAALTGFGNGNDCTMVITELMS